MAQKRITKRKLKRQKRFLIFIIILLSILDITLIIKYINKGNEPKNEQPEPERIQVIEEYRSDKTYYTTITNYKKFKALYNNTKLSYVAVADSTSPTYDKYIELINKYSYNNLRKIYLLEISKLSKSNLKAFYDLDERLETLNSNYFLLVKDGTIIAITEFDEETLDIIIESLGIEE